ncbi:MAG: hypothetical protein JSV91_14155 [Phycisphaerales bacterium]|nr:MAG: hypothetical protein JSV91_14155 [Phycisphaerales bacterium]
MKRLLLLFTATAVAGWLSSATHAGWYDGFDTYADGQWLDGGADDGGWKGWFNDPAFGAQVTSAYWYSSPHSVDIVGNADLVHEFAGADYGQWIFTAWQYVPDNFSGLSYFILLNTYNDAGSGLNWSTQVSFDSSTGLVNSEFEGATLPMITGQWVELRVEIDLDNDWQEFYYGGNLLTAKSWSDGVSGGGALNIGAVDLFANGATSVYYDNMSLVPTPGAGVLLVLGLAARRRRR